MKKSWAWVVGGIACIAIGAVLAAGIENGFGAEPSVAAVVSERAPSVAEVMDFEYRDPAEDRIERGLLRCMSQLLAQAVQKLDLIWS
jgi:hypothetical protein